MLGDFFKYLASEASVILDAPVTFVMGLAVLWLLTWRAMDWRYGGTIESQRERLQARDEKIADYKAKLEGAEPEEARAHIKELEARLAALEPRRLSAAEQQAIATKLRGSVGEVYVLIDDRANRRLASDLADVFRDAGWTAHLDEVVGFFEPSTTDIVVVVDDAGALQPIQATAVAALHAAGLKPEIRSGLNRHLLTPADMNIRVTSVA